MMGCFQPVADAAAMGVSLAAQVDEVFRQADVVSLHTPLISETRGFVDGTRLRLMKPTAFFYQLLSGRSGGRAGPLPCAGNGRHRRGGYRLMTCERTEKQEEMRR
jgi:hypothetical protein